MIITQCMVGIEKMSAEAARDTLVINQRTAPQNKSIEQLQVVTALCNAGQFDAASRKLPLAEKIIHGDATDQAILRFSESLSSVSEVRRCWQCVYDLAFNSKNKYMIKVFRLSHPDGLESALPTDTASTFKPKDMYVNTDTHMHQDSFC
jgi:sodium/potassium-transporting ATPase subunit alpha